MSSDTNPKDKIPPSQPDTPLQILENGQGVLFYGIDTVMFWTKPSLFSMLQPLFEELGEDLYSRLIAYEASKGTSEDYQWMISNPEKNFELGFQIWGNSVANAGWGRFDLRSIDWKDKHAVVLIENPWELRLFECQNEQNNIPFLNGKISGVFSHAFGTNCRAEVSTVVKSGGGVHVVVLDVRPSRKTLEQALLEIQTSGNSKDQASLLAANNALRRSERRLLDVIATVGEFVWEADSNLNLTYATKQVYEILRIPEDGFVGNSWQNLMPPEEFARLEGMLESLQHEVQFAEGEFYLLDRYDEKLWVHLRIKKLLDFNRNHCGYVGSGRNISAEKALKTQLFEQQRHAEMSAKMATLGEMAGGVAHEINTPLAVISLIAEELVETLPPGTDTHEQVKILHQTAWKIAKIVQGLKSFSRDASNDPSAMTSVQSMVNDTLTMCRMRFQSVGVELRVGNIPSKLMINCRSTQISQVLLNLLNNAFDAAVTLPEKWISLEVQIVPQKVLIRVTDSGHGIPLDVQEKMMRPFFTTKEIGKGTGLGLSISSGIIESHGGRLIYDRMAPNTTFVIELPL